MWHLKRMKREGMEANATTTGRGDLSVAGFRCRSDGPGGGRNGARADHFRARPAEAGKPPRSASRAWAGFGAFATPLATRTP